MHERARSGMYNIDLLITMDCALRLLCKYVTCNTMLIVILLEGGKENERTIMAKLLSK